MHEGEERKIKLITVAGVVLVFILVLILVTLVSQSIQLNIKKKNLEKQLQQLEQVTQEGKDEYEYRQTLEWVEKYLREKEGMIDAGDSLWKPAE